MGESVTVRCPSELALEEYLLEGDSSEHASHVEACASCRARVARMEEEGRQFISHVFPATVAKIEAAVDRTARWKSWRMLLVPAAAAFAVLLLTLRPAVGPAPVDGDADGTQLKGTRSLRLSVFVGTDEGARQVADGAATPARSAVRFKVRPPSACRLWIASVDGAGAVSRLYPTSGDGGAEIRTVTALPGGAVLDGAAGPERIFGFCTPHAVGYETIERALRRAFTGGVPAVRSVKWVPGLPDGTAQDSVLIEKTR